MEWLRKTHGPQFELTRHFLARMLDGEWSSTAGQWQTVATGAIAMLLPAGLLLVRETSSLPQVSRKLTLLSGATFRAAVLADELSLQVLLAVITGLVALLQWQTLFPTQRDYFALASLPVSPRRMFTAKFTAVLLF